MPRPSRLRSVEGEANLARRVRRERERRGLSYEALAKLLTEAGCRIQGSAIFKIEKGDPPRRVTVDELIAFANVFEVSVENLLTPVGVLHTRRAQELLKEIDEGDNQLVTAVTTLVNAYAEYFDLAAYEPDLREYIDGHRFGRDVARDSVEAMPLMRLILEVGDESHEVALEDSRLRAGVLSMYEAIVQTASEVALTAIEENKARGIAGSPIGDED